MKSFVLQLMLLLLLPSSIAHAQSFYEVLPESCRDTRQDGLGDVARLIDVGSARGDVSDEASVLGELILPAVPGIAAHEGREARISLTGKELTWFARLVYCEARGQSAEHLAMLQWSIVQRLTITRERRGDGDITGLIESFSQCLNPIWRRGGSMCPTDESIAAAEPGQRAHLRRVRRENAGQCTEEMLDNRDRFHRMQYEDIPAPYRRAALNFVLGRVPNIVPGATDFAVGYGPASDCRRLPTQTVLYYESGGRRYREWSPRRHSIVFCGDSRLGSIRPQIQSPRWLRCSADARTSLSYPGLQSLAELRDQINRTVSSPPVECDTHQ